MRILFSLLAALMLQMVQAQDAVEATLYYDDEKVVVGTEAPAFSGTDLGGAKVDSEALLESGDLVVVFYRGVWCGYCREHLTALQDSLSYLTEAGVQLVVVTPEQPTFIQQVAKETGSTYPIIQDADYSIMSDFGVAYTITEGSVTKYRSIVTKKTAKSNGNDDGVLPVPATFVIGQDGKVKWRHFDPDYSQRSSIAEILKVVG